MMAANLEAPGESVALEVYEPARHTRGALAELTGSLKLAVENKAIDLDGRAWSNLNSV